MYGLGRRVPRESPGSDNMSEDNPISGFPKIRGTFFGGPHNKDYSILGSLLGSPYFGKLPYISERSHRHSLYTLYRYLCSNAIIMGSWDL